MHKYLKAKEKNEWYWVKGRKKEIRWWKYGKKAVQNALEEWKNKKMNAYNKTKKNRKGIIM